MKKPLYLLFMLLSLLCLVIVTLLGASVVFKFGEWHNILQFVTAFFGTMLFFSFGAVFMDYEGLRTPINMLINGLFYFFIIAMVVFTIMFIKNQINNNKKH